MTARRTEQGLTPVLVIACVAVVALIAAVVVPPLPDPTPEVRSVVRRVARLYAAAATPVAGGRWLCGPGRCPDGLPAEAAYPLMRWLRARGVDVGQVRIPVDPWGHAIAVVPEDRGVRVLSAGPDGVVSPSGGGDDIVVRIG